MPIIMSKRKLYYNVQAGDQSADIFIYGIIGSSWWDSGTTASGFVQDFRALEAKYDRINIHINSPGGDIHEGLPIVNAIRASKKDVHTYVDGIAYSMAAIIAISAKTVHIASNGMLMMHNASTVIWGNAQELRTEADVLDKYDDSLLQTIADRTGESPKDIKEKWFNYKDNYLTASEAKDAKLVDVIENYQAEGLPSDMKDKKNVWAHYERHDSAETEENLFQNILTKIRSALGLKNNIVSSTPISMDFKNSLEILNKENPTPAELAAVKNEITAFTGANEKFTASEVEAKVNSAIEASNKALEEANRKATEAQNSLTTAQSKIAELEKQVPPVSDPVNKDKKDPETTSVKDEFRTSFDEELEQYR